MSICYFSERRIWALCHFNKDVTTMTALLALISSTSHEIVTACSQIKCLCPSSRTFMWMTRSLPAGPTAVSTPLRSFQSIKMVGINNLMFQKHFVCSLSITILKCLNVWNHSILIMSKNVLVIIQVVWFQYKIAQYGAEPKMLNCHCCFQKRKGKMTFSFTRTPNRNHDDRCVE